MSEIKYITLSNSKFNDLMPLHFKGLNGFVLEIIMWITLQTDSAVVICLLMRRGITNIALK